MAINAIDKAKELFNQLSSGVGSFAQRGMVTKPIGGNTPNFQPYQQALQNIGNYFNPTSGYNPNTYQTNNFWTTPIARALANIQQFNQNAPLVNFQPLAQNIKAPIPRIGAQLGLGIAENTVNIPSRILRAGSTLGTNIRTGEIRNPATAIGTAAKVALPLIDITTLGGGTIVKGLGEQALKQAGKESLKQAVKTGIKQGGVYGGTYGLLSGLSEGEKADVLNGVKSLISGGLLGGALGGAVGGTGNIIGQVFNAVKKQHPTLPDREVAKKTVVYLRDAAGRYTGVVKRKDVFIPAGMKPYPKVREPLKINDWKTKVDQELGINPEAVPVGLSIKNIRERGVKNITPEVPNISQLPKTIMQPSIVSPKTTGQQPQMGKIQGLVQKKPLSKLSEQLGQPYNLDSILQKVKDKVNTIYTATLDRFHPLSLLAKQAGQDQTMRNALTGYYGSGSIGKYYTDFELSPIFKSVDANDLRSYTIAQRDLELAGRNIQGSNVGKPTKILNGLRQKYGGNLTQLDQVATRLYDYQKNLVNTYLVDTGIISKENASTMFSKNQKYVPFKRIMDTVDEYLGGVPQTKGAGSVGSQNVIKNIKGSQRQIKDPLESIIENTYKIVGLGKRQQVAQTIVGLGKDLPKGVIKPVGNEAYTTIVIKGTEGKAEYRKVLKPEFLQKPDVISLFKDGKRVAYHVPIEVADAAKGLSEQGMNILVKILGVPTRVFRQTATGANPEFALPNIVRDLQSAFVNIGLNPLKFVSGLAHYMKKDEVYQEFLRSGGLTSRLSLDQPFLRQTVQDLTGIKSKGLSLVDPRRIYSVLQAIGQASEQPTRIAAFQKVYNQALKQGLSIEEARTRGAYAAQEATVNFARRGAVTQPINSIYAFLNARAQGVDRFIRTIKNDPIGASFRIGLITAAPAIALYAHNKSFPSFSDPRIVPDYEKQNNFIIMLSDQPIPQLGGAQYIKIPKGDIGKIANPIEAFMSYADGKGGDVGKALQSVLQGFSPITDVGGLIPTALRPLIENAANYSFYQQRPLLADSKKNYPTQFQFNKSTPDIYKELGARLGQSPAMIENLIRGYLTGFARIGEMITKPFAKQNTYSGQDINQVPVARRFLGGAVRSEDEQMLNDYFQQKGILNKVQDIKIGIKYGNIPLEDGMNEINKLLQQTKQVPTKPQSYLGIKEVQATENQPQNTMQQKLAEEKAKLQIQMKGGWQIVNNKLFYSENGTVKTIDFSKPLERPKLTGYEDIDKVLNAKYSSQLTTEVNNLVKLAQLGQITPQQANELIIPLKQEQERLKIRTIKAKQPKAIKPKKIIPRRVSARKTVAPKPIKFNLKTKPIKFKTKKVKLAKYKPIKK